MWFCLVRGSTSDSFSGRFFFVWEIYWQSRGSTSGRFSGRLFFGREIYWHSRGIIRDSFICIRERYWQVRSSIKLSSERFMGGLSLVDGRLGWLFSFIFFSRWLFSACASLSIFLFLLSLYPSHAPCSLSTSKRYHESQPSKKYPQSKCPSSRGEGRERGGIKNGEGGASGK